MTQPENNAVVPPPSRRGLGSGDQNKRSHFPRRSFLAALITPPILALPAGKTAQTNTLEQKRIFIQRSPIAGFQYYDGPRISAFVSQQRELILQREPHNHFDKRAVAIYWQGHKVGFVPRREDRVIAQMMDRGEKLQAKLYSVSTGYEQWNGWEIDIEAVV